MPNCPVCKKSEKIFSYKKHGGVCPLVLRRLPSKYQSSVSHPAHVQLLTDDLIDTNTLIEGYEHSVNTSRVLQRDDKKLMSNWSDEFQVRRLDVSVKYRLQMLQHKEHSFRTNGNLKWAYCLRVHGREITNCDQFYHKNELECIRASASEDTEKNENVEQLDKEIVKWRRGYRYLKKLCSMENPSNQEKTEQCLVQYMRNDKYDQVIVRLIFLKLSAVNQLYTHYNSSLISLEECLRTQLSRFLEKIRALMEVLHKCYNIMP